MQALSVILRVVIAIFTPPSDAEIEGLHRFAPEEVSVEHARDHVWCARVAAAIYDDSDGLVRHVDTDTVLAIDYHESHFTDGAVGRESGGRVSCGAMTPTPTDHCDEKPLLAQILEGTRHLVVDWGTARDVRSTREAYLGYAGGYTAIRKCRVGPVLRYGDHGDDLCMTPEVFAWIRSRIQETRRPRTSS
jgi:hypothetical protein